MHTKADLISDLRTLLRDAIAAKGAGAAPMPLGRAQGYVDGFMRALLDAGIATRAELLSVVAEERATVDGPAVGERSYEEPSADSQAA